MRNTWIIFRREMRSYFVSPVAYAILVAFLGVSGWAFFHTLSSFVIYAARATEIHTPAAVSAISEPYASAERALSSAASDCRPGRPS